MKVLGEDEREWVNQLASLCEEAGKDLGINSNVGASATKWSVELRALIARSDRDQEGHRRSA